jgi:alpha-beta hydrolase superfamily lysophospholipase
VVGLRPAAFRHKRTGAKILRGRSVARRLERAPARTPFDWLSRDNAEVDAFINDPLCFPSHKPDSMQSFLGAFPRLADPREIRKVRDDLPVYIFSGSDDPVGQRLEGVRVLIDRYRSAGLASIAHDFYSDGRHEMLHEINRRDVITNLLIWISGILKKSS